jgi:hypothetical protein
MGKKRVYREYRDTSKEKFLGIIAVIILIFFLIGFLRVLSDVNEGL